MIKFSDMPKYKGYVEILEHLGEQEPSDEEVWLVARESEDIPWFANILYELILSKIEYQCQRNYENYDVSYYVNDLDTHLYCDGQEIYALDDFKEVFAI